MSERFMQHNLVTPNHSAFKTSNSTNLILLLTRNGSSGYEVRGISLDISKAFDKVSFKSIAKYLVLTLAFM